MKKIILTLSLSSLLICCVNLQAMPVSFNDVSYTTTAFSSAGAIFDGPYTDTSPSASLPLLTSSTAISANQQASATAIADHLFLSTSVDATSTTDPTSTAAISTFTGTFFAPAGLLRFVFNFDAQRNGLGTTENQLAFSLVANGLTLYNELFNSSTTLIRDFILPLGSFATLDLTLSSTADAFQNNAFGLASTDFSLNTVNVAEPGAWFLVLAGVLLLGLTRRTRTSHPLRFMAGN